MNRGILLRLYARKDPKRKRLLFDLFKDTIAMHASLSMIAELINQELGKEDLIKANDIKYCRHYFLNKANSVVPVKESPGLVAKTITTNPELPVEKTIPKNGNVTWTNPDNLPASSNKEVKSKFSK